MTTAAEIRQVRDWVGSAPDDLAIQQAITDTGTIKAAALSLLRQRRADMNLNMGGKLAVARDVTIEITPDQLNRVDAIIHQLEAELGTGPGQVTVARLTHRSERSLRGRRWGRDFSADAERHCW